MIVHRTYWILDFKQLLLLLTYKKKEKVNYFEWLVVMTFQNILTYFLYVGLCRPTSRKIQLHNNFNSIINNCLVSY